MVDGRQRQPPSRELIPRPLATCRATPRAVRQVRIRPSRTMTRGHARPAAWAHSRGGLVAYGHANRDCKIARQWARRSAGLAAGAHRCFALRAAGCRRGGALGAWMQAARRAGIGRSGQAFSSYCGHLSVRKARKARLASPVVARHCDSGSDPNLNSSCTELLRCRFFLHMLTMIRPWQRACAEGRIHGTKIAIRCRGLGRGVAT